jgi:hypothetical protein
MATPDANLASLAKGSQLLESMLALESGEGLEGRPELAFFYLKNGQLQPAVDAAANDPSMRDHVLWFAAASTGAPRDLVQRALATELPGAESRVSWSALALASREGAPVGDLPEKLRALPMEGAGKVLDFFAAVQAGASVAEAESHLDAVPPYLRGIAYGMAATYLGERCPASWRNGASRLLFAPERPHFG